MGPKANSKKNVLKDLLILGFLPNLWMLVEWIESGDSIFIISFVTIFLIWILLLWDKLN